MKKTTLTDEELEYIACYLEGAAYSLSIDGNDEELKDAEIMSTIAKKCRTIVTERYFSKEIRRINRLRGE